MFSQACVKSSVHMGGGVHPSGRQADTPLGRHPFPRGRRQSYWNAFLFIMLSHYMALMLTLSVNGPSIGNFGE